MTKNRLGKLFVVTALTLSMVITSFAYLSGSGAGDASAASKVMSWNKARSIFVDEVPGNGGIKYLRLTTDDGRKVYVGKAVYKNRLYSIEMNAYTGRIYDFESDYIGSRYSASKVGAVSKATITSKIKKVVPGAVILYVRLTRDDGRYVYEAEAYKNGREYDFEYSKRGTLLDYDMDRV